MKGLLLKDFYVARKHCKVFVIIMAVFMAISFAGDGDLFFLIYPCFLTGMIPVTLLSYDEHSRWSEYSGNAPLQQGTDCVGKVCCGYYYPGGCDDYCRSGAGGENEL